MYMSAYVQLGYYATCSRCTRMIKYIYIYYTIVCVYIFIVGCLLGAMFMTYICRYSVCA